MDNFFILDTIEDPFELGSVLLFGKSCKSHKTLTCCLKVQGLNRKFFFTLKEFKNDPEEFIRNSISEITNIMECHGIKKYALTQVKRNIFEADFKILNAIQTLIKVKYPAIHVESNLKKLQPALYLGLKGLYFRFIICVNSLSVESILLKRGIFGSSWLYLNNVTVVDSTNKISNCNLEYLADTPKKIFSRNDIGKIINILKERTIDVMITRLRQKIESNPKNPKYLQTIRGSGYVLWIE
jgi:hypothetical protein